VDFDTFFATSWSDMLARALMLANSRHDAEDAVQDAFAEALRGWDRISGYDNPGAWVYRIVRQRLWKSARRWRRVGPVDPLSTWHTDEGDPVRFVEVTTALAALAALPARQRMVMIMHCLQQMEQQQIADELGLSRGTVAATIFKARRKLAVELGTKDTELSRVEKPGLAMVRHTDMSRDPLTVLLVHVVEWLTDRVTEEYDADSLVVVHRKAGVR
jgi:RNA polymerase sigma factor (sigma-70 family)